MDYCGKYVQNLYSVLLRIMLFEVLNTAYQKTTLSIPKIQYVNQLINFILV